MKLLKITNKKACYYDFKEEKYKTIKEITKENILKIALKILIEDGEFEIFEEDKISNPAEQIIYQRLSEEFEEIKKERENIIANVEEEFKPLKEKYERELIKEDTTKTN